ncbi:MAG TPA: hypothetical protein VGP47_03135, partial [Parachlamydiaceae bacterium]|nr:hypothetical protein [Parachlamydiaceae bacterium]
MLTIPLLQCYEPFVSPIDKDFENSFNQLKKETEILESHHHFAVQALISSIALTILRNILPSSSIVNSNLASVAFVAVTTLSGLILTLQLHKLRAKEKLLHGLVDDQIKKFAFDPQKENAVMVTSTYNPNRAFLDTNAAKIKLDVARNFNLYHTTISDKEGLNKTFENATKDGQLINLFIINAHGNEEQIVLGQGNANKFFENEVITDGVEFQEIEKYLAKDAVGILNSCSTGKKIDGVAQRITNYLNGRKIFAP